MKASEILIAKIKEFEGLRLEAYKAVQTEKYYTIGYGHYSKDVKAGMKITVHDADLLLRHDVATAVAQVEALNLPELTQGQADALIDFAYNCGITNLKSSTLLRKVRLNLADRTIPSEFMRWTRSGGKVLRGLVGRRAWEAKRWKEQS